MSKCKEAYEEFEKTLISAYGFANWQVKDAWQAAWNVRGKVDAEICDDIQRKSRAWSDIAKNCKEAIAKENEK